ncbi:MAG: glycosyltransferase [Candidatus Shapirobacteria bacterium]
MKILSIITITRNNPDIKKTLDSLISQEINPHKIEHIIIDNLSSDNTSQIVRRYQKTTKYPVIYIREKDTGRYNAMNKGIANSKGRYLLFLNAGDSLHSSETLLKVLPKLTTDILYGDIQDKSLKKYPINQQFFLNHTIFHQAAFIKQSLFKKYGYYDESLIISGDFDFFIKTIIKHHVTTAYLPLVISNYDRQGISSQKLDLVYQERAKIITRYYSGKIFFYNYLKYLYYCYKKYLPKFITNLQQKRLADKPKI